MIRTSKKCLSSFSCLQVDHSPQRKGLKFRLSLSFNALNLKTGHKQFFPNPTILPVGQFFPGNNSSQGNILACNKLGGESFGEKLFGEELFAEEFSGEELSRKELSLGKNCLFGRIVRRQILSHRCGLSDWYMVLRLYDNQIHRIKSCVTV